LVPVPASAPWSWHETRTSSTAAMMELLMAVDTIS
jgi:hypothetical protein